MREISILCLGGGNRVSLYERLQSAGTHFGLKVKLVSLELHDFVPACAVASVLKAPRFDNPSFKEYLFNLLKKQEFAAILPLMDSAIPIVAQLDSDCIKLTGRHEMAETFLSKNKTKRFFDEKNIKAIPNDHSFPKLVKPDLGFGARNHQIASNASELDEIISQYSGNYIIQNLIRGKEYTVDCWFGEETVHYSIRERLSVRSGEVITSITVDNQNLIAHVLEVLSKVEWYGPLTYQFFETAGTQLAIEINGRLGGGVINSIEAGFRVDKAIIATAARLQVKEEFFQVKPNCKMVRANREFFQWQ
jgi:carbamoylphosphate synthase large subunit